ncbi:hypothetical protein OEZ86_005543 [Tetradesmus obliquus]|nr:hypothetical protein OEZ86_005543 [Tetradesmus obliquus]
MARAALALLLLALVLHCATLGGAQAAEDRLPSASHARSLQQQQFDDSPLEQDVSAYLADLAAAAGMRVEDLRFDSTLDDKAPPVQLPQPPTPGLLRLLSRMANARGNPAYQGPGLPGPNFPGFGGGRPSSLGASGQTGQTGQIGQTFDSKAGGFGAPGSNQPYQLPERFRHYLGSDPLHLPSLSEPQQQQQQQPQGYNLESAQLDTPQQQQQQQTADAPQIGSLITKLAGRGRKFGTSQGGISHEMLHASIPRLESAPIGPPSLDASAHQQLAQQPGVLTFGSRMEEGQYRSTDPAAEQLLAELQGLDPVLAKQQFQSLLNRVGGRSASVSEASARKQYVPRMKATPLAPGGPADSSSSSWQGSAAGALRDAQEQQQQELMDGRDSRNAYGNVLKDSVELAEPREIDRDAGKAAASAAAAAGQPFKVDILQVDPATLAALEQEPPLTFDQIQGEAAAVAAADPMLYSRSKQLPVQQQQQQQHQQHQQAPAAKDEVIVPVGLASHLMPGSEGLSAAGSSKGANKGLHAGAATGIALGAFGAVLFGAGLLLFVQAKKMEEEVDSGYTPTALSEGDLELASHKPPAVCISPAAFEVASRQLEQPRRCRAGLNK